MTFTVQSPFTSPHPSPLQMRVLRIHTDPNHPTPFRSEFVQAVGVGGQFGRADEGEVERVEEEEGVAGFGGVEGMF